MNKKYDNLINQLQKTLDDPKVKSNQKLADSLALYKYKLENGEEYRLICAKLTSIISSYVREHHFKAPESVLKLYNSLANGNAQYRGLASFLTWF